MYVLLLAVPGCAISCLGGHNSRSQIMKSHVASKKYISVLSSTYHMIKASIAKVLVTGIALVTLKILEALAIYAAG